jgi:2-polyprenyl-3-methyl-5-hydroxy-6-metoxy-1,4-benzoquinol methylase
MKLFERLLISKLKLSRKIALPNLSGDRDVEWPFVASRIGRYANKDSYVLDFGCGIGTLSLAAASLEARVLAIDLLPLQFAPIYSSIEFRQTDVMQLDDSSESFDLVLNCSTIEHVGLGGRYNSVNALDGDLEAMQKLRKLIKPKGIMLLTLPMGQDAVISPLHRIFGAKRLPRLLEGYKIIESIFFRKNVHNVWTACSQWEACTEAGNDHY